MTTNLQRNLVREAKRVGYGRALQSSLHSVASKYIQLRRLEMIYLPRQELPPLDPVRFEKHSARMANYADLLAMRDEGEWNITRELLDGFQSGDKCLLSYVDNELGGYTWVHSKGHPRLVPGLRVRIPDDYLYNYAGFTHPNFRGLSLQSYRHHQVLARPEWSTRKGLIGYVEHTNWSSKRGQSKSGYRTIDHLTLLGNGRRPFVHFSDDLKNFGLQRIHD